MKNTMNPIWNRTFTIRQVAAINGESPVTLQSWADKGWAQIAPAPGPGQPRRLNVCDAYMLSIASAFAKITKNPQLANRVAHGAIYNDSVRKRIVKRQLETGAPYLATAEDIADEPAFTSRYVADPYLLLAGVGRIQCVPPITQERPGAVVTVAIVPARHLADVASVDVDQYGLFLPFTQFLVQLDEALRTV